MKDFREQERITKEYYKKKPLAITRSTQLKI